MRVRIHPSFCIYLLCITVLSSLSDALAMLLALAVHEICHYMAAKLIGERFSSLELTPFGGVMRYAHGSTSSKGLKGVFLHAAGPMGNYAFLLAAGTPIIQDQFPAELLRSTILSNSSMLLINLLPALPLDGGQIVFCLGYYLFPIAKLTAVLTALGVITGTLGMLISIYGLMCHQTLNCSLFIVSLYLMIIAVQSRSHLLCENICVVAQEKLEDTARIQQIRSYQAASDTPLLDLLPLLKQKTAVRVFFIKENRQYELTDMQLCRALLATPSATLLEAYLLSSQYKEKKSAIP